MHLNVVHLTCDFPCIYSRDLKYVIVFPDYQGKHHTFLIKQQLPASVYVSTDQLDDLKRFDKVMTISNKIIDFFFYRSAFALLDNNQI